ncbi:hypothetical protein tb265_17090 [Gemmatimonadetes bacterium T265]|nr:hypothetical protein tb265_17090 [Gemmatimonadetes bacterium T265]
MALRLPTARRGTVRTSVALAALAALAACSDSVTAPTSGLRASAVAPSLEASPELNPGAHRMHRVREYYASHNAGKTGSGTGISYHGGALLTAKTNVAAVYWAAAPVFTNGPTPGTYGAASGDASLVGFFLSHIGGSPYFNINTTYYNGSGTHVTNQVNYTQYWAANTSVPAAGASVTDAQMIALLQAGFNSGALTYDASTVYAIFSAGTVNLGGGFGTQYCAYHTTGTVTVGGVSKTVIYAAMPYNYAYPSSCTSGLGAPNGDPGADYEVNTLVHEVEESTTDYLGNAWYDRQGYENADKCAWTWGTTSTAANGAKYNITIGGKNFLVQQNWVNAGSGGCALKY